MIEDHHTHTREHGKRKCSNNNAKETSDRSSALRKMILLFRPKKRKNKRLIIISTTRLSTRLISGFFCFQVRDFDRWEEINAQRERERKTNKQEDRSIAQIEQTKTKEERETDLFIIIIIVVVQLSVGDKPIVNLHCMNISKQRRGSTYWEKEIYVHIRWRCWREPKTSWKRIPTDKRSLICFHRCNYCSIIRGRTRQDDMARFSRAHNEHYYAYPMD